MTITPTADVTRASRKRPAATTHFAAVDGLRAFAVAGVIAFHLGMLPGGFLGVDLFFVVSGYVITRMILREREATGRFRVGSFWVRRVKRLLPAVLLVLVGVQLWMHLADPVGLESVIDGQSASSLVWATNWYDIFTQLPYAEAGPDASPLNHLWSLAIEEQFYVVWPLVVLLVRSRRVLVGTIVAGMAASALLGLTVGQHWSLDRLYQGTDIRAFALLAGALIAALGIGEEKAAGDGSVRPRTQRRSPTRMVAPWVAVAASAALGWMWATTPLDKSLFSGPLLCASVLGAILVASLVLSGPSLISALLSMRLLTAIGRRSYALYLWHWPVIIIVSETFTGWTGMRLAAARIVATVALTLISYALVENPIRRMGYRGPKLWLGLVATVAVVIGLVAVPPLSVKHGEDGGSGSASVPGPAAEWPLPAIAPGTSVLVVGDSWAENLARGMEAPAFGADVVNLGLGGCGIADPDAYMNDDETVVPPPAQCLRWRTRWAEAVAQRTPDAVVLDVGNYDQRRARIDGRWVYVGDRAFDQRYADHLDQAVEIFSSAGIPVYLTTTVVLNDQPFHDHSIAMNRLLLAAAERHPEVTVVDLGHFLCRADEIDRCPRARDGMPIYDATGHLAPHWQTLSAQYTLGVIQATPAPGDARG